MERREDSGPRERLLRRKRTSSERDWLSFRRTGVPPKTVRKRLERILLEEHVVETGAALIFYDACIANGRCMRNLINRLARKLTHQRPKKEVGFLPLDGRPVVPEPP